jgi:hypothetical protein
MNRIVGLVTLGAALIVPAFAAPQQNTPKANATTGSPAACEADGRHLDAVNAEYVWRLRAYEHIDCALAILDDAMKTEGRSVMLSREQAEEVRTNVWKARDAAARIGR